MAGLLVLLLVFLCFLNMYLVFKIWNLEDRITVPSLSLVERAYRPPLQRYKHYEEEWLNHFASQSIHSSGGNSWMEVLREQEVQHHRDLQARNFLLNHAFLFFCQIEWKSHLFFITRTGNQLLTLHPSCYSKQRTQWWSSHRWNSLCLSFIKRSSSELFYGRALTARPTGSCWKLWWGLKRDMREGRRRSTIRGRSSRRLGGTC